MQNWAILIEMPDYGDILSVSFFVTLTSIVYKELLPKGGDNVTKNDTLFFQLLLRIVIFGQIVGEIKSKQIIFFKI